MTFDCFAKWLYFKEAEKEHEIEFEEIILDVRAPVCWLRQKHFMFGCSKHSRYAWERKELGKRAQGCLSYEISVLQEVFL